jgi:hypothetical protein
MRRQVGAGGGLGAQEERRGFVPEAERDSQIGGESSDDHNTRFMFHGDLSALERDAPAASTELRHHT